MPGTVLRVSGSKTKIKKFLSESTLDPIKVYYRGEPSLIKSRGPNKTSGFNICLSVSQGTSIRKQANQTAKFIEAERKEFERLASYNFKNTIIDFGLYDMSTEERPWPSYRLPKKLVKIACEFGLEIEMSFYGKP